MLFLINLINYIFLKALPCTKAHIDANPSLKEDHIRVVLAGEFPVNYDAFNDEVASGIIRKFSKSIPSHCLSLAIRLG